VFSGMIGVTFFGILLTPVFYLLIARAAEWQVFRSGILAEFGALLLDALRMGPIHRAGVRFWQWVAEATKRRPQQVVKSSPAKKPAKALAHAAAVHTEAGQSAESASEGLQRSSHE
jgi:hypothetical protein